MSLTAACTTVVEAARRLSPSIEAPLVIGIDGRSGVGKTTLASQVAREVEAAVVPMDDFFAGFLPYAAWDSMAVEERAERVFEWPRLRSEALLPLLAGQTARWHPFDWGIGARAGGTYAREDTAVEVHPAAIVLLDGVYSCGPQLADLVSVRVLIGLPDGERRARLARRQDPAFLEPWHARWDAVEEFYFSRVRPSRSFDVVVSTSSA